MLTIDRAIEEFAADLRIDKAPKTILTYTESARLFARHHDGETIRSITSDSIRDWLLDLRERGRSESTLSNRYRGLRAFLNWAAAEELIEENPILGVPEPRPPERPVQTLTIEQLQSILRTCDRTFEGTRDEALIRLLVDTGMRRSECATLTVEALDFEHDTATVLAKGNRIRVCPFGPRTAKQLRRYLRARLDHSYAERPELWVGRRGPLGATAILLVLRRRAKAAKIDGRVFVHQLRHTWADQALRSGMQEGDVMRLAGWRSREMLGRYGSIHADERAREAYRPVSLGDKL